MHVFCSLYFVINFFSLYQHYSVFIYLHKKPHLPQVRYTTNEDYMAAIPEECDGEAVSPETGEGVGIVLDIKPKMSTVVHQDSGENKIILDATQNEKGKDDISAL